MSVRLFPMMPFSEEGDLGRAYNESIALVPEDAWVALLDHDMMFTTRGWFAQLREAIEAKPEAGAFTVVTNRIAAPWQKAGDPNCHDIRKNREFGKRRAETTRTLLDITETKGFGGVVCCVSKAAWREVGGFIEGATLCVDHGFHFATRAKGRRVYLIEGLYVYHWRRAFGDELPTHIKRVESCPCRGPEPTPTERFTLPRITR